MSRGGDRYGLERRPRPPRFDGLIAAFLAAILLALIVGVAIGRLLYG